MTERTAVIRSLRDDSSDSISLNSSQDSDVDQERTYVVDRILAEQGDDEGNRFYLIKWEGYVLLASTWEPAENIVDQTTFDIWEEEKKRIERGSLEPFDVTRFEDELSQVQSAKADRRQRRKAKRHRLGIAVSPFGSGSEVGFARNGNDSDFDENFEDIEDEPDHPSPIPVPPRQAKQMQFSEQRDITQKDGLASKEKAPKNDEAKRTQRDKHKPSPVTDSSEDSLVEELKHKSQRRREKSSRPSTAVQKKAATIRKAVAVESEESSSNETPTTAPQNTMRRKTSLNAEPPSRTGYQGTARKTLTATSLRRIPTPLRGSSRGRGRGSALGGVFGFTRKNPAPGVALKQKRTLGNAILNAPKLDPKKPTEHFKTPSMVRKAELASRALADRAPDMASIGRLTKPSEYSSIRPVRRILTEPISALPRRNSDVAAGNTSAEQFANPDDLNPLSPETRYDDDNLVNNEEHKDMSPATKSKGKDKQIAEKDLILENEFVAQQAQIANPVMIPPLQGRSYSLPHASRHIPKTATDIKMLYRDIPHGAPTGPRRSALNSNRKAAAQGEKLDSSSTMNSNPNNLATDLGASLPEPTSAASVVVDTEASNSPQQDGPSSRLVKKMNLRDYGSRRKSELLGHALPIQIVFGDKETMPVSVGLTNIDKSSAQSWVHTLVGLETINFNQLCLAQDFKAQDKFLQGRVLVDGSIIIAGSNGSKLVEEAAERLRPLAGLISTHSAFKIIIYPAKCEEWKFLDNNKAGDLSSVLRYQIYEPPVDTGGDSANTAKEEFTYPIDLKRDYLESLVASALGLKYSALVSSGTDEMEHHNFYLLFPRTATSTAGFLASWLRACNPKCRVFTHQKPGSWDYFTTSYMVKAGVVIIHRSLVASIFKIPRLYKLIYGIRHFIFWCIDESLTLAHFDSNFSPNYKAPPTVFGMVQLLPHGGAILLTPSFLITHPQRTYDLLKWFQKRLRVAISGSWKIVVAFGCRQYLLDLAIQKASERTGLLTSPLAQSNDLEEIAKARGLSAEECEVRFLNYNLLDELLRDENMVGYPFSWEVDNPDEVLSPVIYADKSINADDEKTLVSWFAGWTMLHLHLFRKLIVLGTSPSKSGSTSPIKDGDMRRNSSRRGSMCSTSVECETVATKGQSRPNVEATVGASSTGPAKGRLHATSVTVKDESSSTTAQPIIPASKLSTTARTHSLIVTRTSEGRIEEIGNGENKSRSRQKSNDAQNFLQNSIISSRERPQGSKNAENGLKECHSIDESTDHAILQFIAITGADKQTAEKYLEMYNNDPHFAAQKHILAVAAHLKSQSVPQTEVANSKGALLGFIVSTHASHQVARHFLHEAQQDVQRAIALYNEAMDEPSKDPRNLSEVIGEKGQDENKRPTISGIVSDGDGMRRFVPTSVRSSGSDRPEISIRPGYVPPEDKAVYKIQKAGGVVTQFSMGDSSSAGFDAESKRSVQGEVGTQSLSRKGTTSSENAAAAPKNNEIKGVVKQETTTEWYESLKMNGQRWEHIYVCGWETCFPILKIKSD